MVCHSAIRFLVFAVGWAALTVPSLAFAEDILDNLGDAKSPAATPAKPGAAATTADAKPTGSESKPSEVSTNSGATKPAVASPATLDRIKAVPRKTLLKQHRFELSPFAMVSLNDAFYQHLAAGGTAIFYPHDAFGIGVGADYLYTHLATKNIDAVRENLTAVPAVLEHPWLFAHVDTYFIPFYGKLSLFADAILNFDLYAVGGAGVAFAGEHRRPEANVGLGQRIALGEWLALRVELRDHLFVDTQTVNGLSRSDVQSYLLLMVGVSMFLPTTFEYTY